MDIRETAAKLGEALCADIVDVEEAIYWWCADHHSGQASEAYSILSTSHFRPGMSQNGPTSSDGILIYEGLCVAEGCRHAAGTARIIM